VIWPLPETPEEAILARNDPESEGMSV
jgi:hypothetical protein